MKNLVLILASLFFVSSTVMANQADLDKKGVQHSEVKEHHDKKKDKKSKTSGKGKTFNASSAKRNANVT